MLFGLLVVVVIGVVALGYRRLPELSRYVGRSVRIARAELRGADPDGLAAQAPAQLRRGHLGRAGTAPAPDPTADHRAAGARR